MRSSLFCSTSLSFTLRSFMVSLVFVALSTGEYSIKCVLWKLVILSLKFRFIQIQPKKWNLDSSLVLWLQTEANLVDNKSVLINHDSLMLKIEEVWISSCTSIVSDYLHWCSHVPLCPNKYFIFSTVPNICLIKQTIVDPLLRVTLKRKTLESTC